MKYFSLLNDFITLKPDNISLPVAFNLSNSFCNTSNFLYTQENISITPSINIDTANKTIGASDGDVLYPIAAAPNPISGANIINLKPKEKVDVILLTLLVLLVINVDAPNLSISLLLKEFIL